MVTMYSYWWYIHFLFRSHKKAAPGHRECPYLRPVKCILRERTHISKHISSGYITVGTCLRKLWPKVHAKAIIERENVSLLLDIEASVIRGKLFFPFGPCLMLCVKNLNLKHTVIHQDMQGLYYPTAIPQTLGCKIIYIFCWIAINIEIIL